MMELLYVPGVDSESDVMHNVHISQPPDCGPWSRLHISVLGLIVPSPQLTAGIPCAPASKAR